ncbi:PH domain-containing protein [Kocuria sp.]|uniref:PH domain-containing protein n=1 Tax=Kocuria sp. TaxID=1871328 RepID=UPI0026DF59C5|nr:PH domain-containing protein [Kocuria sp.]MDO5619160.1 PH domain-containing protein [Kocuria sp.]
MTADVTGGSVIGGGVLVPREPALRVERRVIARWMIGALLRWGLVFAVLAGVAAFWNPSRVWLAAPMLVIAALLLVTCLIEPFWRYHVHRWEIGDNATYTVTGWLRVEWRASPISRIQTVDAIRGPIDQMLGLSTLRITTASSYGAVNVVGLDEKTAREAAERLASLAEVTPGDAT